MGQGSGTEESELHEEGGRRKSPTRHGPCIQLEWGAERGEGEVIVGPLGLGGNPNERTTPSLASLYGGQRVGTWRNRTHLVSLEVVCPADRLGRKPTA